MKFCDFWTNIEFCHSVSHKMPLDATSRKKTCHRKNSRDTHHWDWGFLISVVLRTRTWTSRKNLGNIQCLKITSIVSFYNLKSHLYENSMWNFWPMIVVKVVWIVSYTEKGSSWTAVAFVTAFSLKVGAWCSSIFWLCSFFSKSNTIWNTKYFVDLLHQFS